MKAVVIRGRGGAEALELLDVPDPEPRGTASSSASSPPV